MCLWFCGYVKNKQQKERRGGGEFLICHEKILNLLQNNAGDSEWGPGVDGAELAGG